jgi:hypothetical protein
MVVAKVVLRCARIDPLGLREAEEPAFLAVNPVIRSGDEGVSLHAEARRNANAGQAVIANGENIGRSACFLQFLPFLIAWREVSSAKWRAG